ncbi:uncharacterized protein LOC121867133 [Homarus americanus]|uniref:uncharacterized protein LOC121867133 n=1 Tax=Homarus americanus TaxID=6706 RepID=UPI001C460667|nr:uncharacterized protein LOC121867133 [Homarus americanus]
MQEYDTNFGFLYDLEKLRDMKEDYIMKERCIALDNSLSVGNFHDIDCADLFSELRVLQELIPQETNSALQVLQILKSLNGSFPKAEIAYRILLTVPVTVASGERSFSKLKLIKKYLRTTMSQERLNALAMLSIEKELAESLEYQDLIAEFAAVKVRKMG